MKLGFLWSRPNGPTSVLATIGFVAGGTLLLWSGYIHLHLWNSDGYRHIPTIGPLFFVQAISALALGLASVALRRLLVAMLAIGFAAATMVGFLISVEHGLFGFKDSWLAPDAHLAFGVEIATLIVFSATSALCLLGTLQRVNTGSGGS